VFGRRRAKHLDRVAQLALVATAEAIESSKLDVAADPHRVGVVFGTGIGGIHSFEEGMPRSSTIGVRTGSAPTPCR
jgi:3-oxoacyl-[acyl-carrier-protein] synthase II